MWWWCCRWRSCRWCCVRPTISWRGRWRRNRVWKIQSKQETKRLLPRFASVDLLTTYDCSSHNALGHETGSVMLLLWLKEIQLRATTLILFLTSIRLQLDSIHSELNKLQWTHGCNGLLWYWRNWLSNKVSVYLTLNSLNTLTQAAPSLPPSVMSHQHL